MKIVNLVKITIIMEIVTVKGVKVALVDEEICVNKAHCEGDAVFEDKYDSSVN